MKDETIKIDKLLKIATDLIMSRSEEGMFIENSRQFLDGYSMAVLDVMSKVTGRDLSKELEVFKNEV